MPKDLYAILEDDKLAEILEKIARLLQRTHQLRLGGYRIDHEIRRLDWLNSKAEKLLHDEPAKEQEAPRKAEARQP